MDRFNNAWTMYKISMDAFRARDACDAASVMIHSVTDAWNAGELTDHELLMFLTFSYKLRHYAHDLCIDLSAGQPQPANNPGRCGVSPQGG